MVYISSLLKRFMPGIQSGKEVINMTEVKSESKDMRRVSDELVIAMIEAATKLTEMAAPKTAETWAKSFRTIWNNVKAARNNTVWP